MTFPAPGLYRGTRLANWGQRLIAGLLDYAPVLVIWDILNNTAGHWIGLIIVAANNVVMQGMTGQSFGKRVLGLHLGREMIEPSGDPNVEGTAYLAFPGIGLCLIRQLLHILDIIPLGYGFLRPLRDWKRQTFADHLCKTYVLPPKSPISLQPPRRS